MSTIKTYAAGIVAAIGIAGAALAGAGTAAAATDQPAKPNITASPSFAPQHTAAPAFDFSGGLGYPGRHKYRG